MTYKKTKSGQFAKTFAFEGRELTFKEIACVLGVQYKTFYARYRCYGLDRAVEISRMTDQEREEFGKQNRSNGQKRVGKVGRFPYKGKQYTLADLARLLDVKHQSFFSWVKRYGMEEAIRIAEHPPELRKAEVNKMKHKKPPKGAACNVAIPTLDPDLEYKRRAKYWIRQYGAEGARAKAGMRI